MPFCSQLTLLHGFALGERSSGGIWKFRNSSFKCYVNYSHTMYSSGNIDVRNWVHLFESPCIFQKVQTGSENQPTSYVWSRLCILPREVGGARPGRKAVHAPHLVPSWRMSGAVPPLSYIPSVCNKGQYYLIINYVQKERNFNINIWPFGNSYSFLV